MLPPYPAMIAKLVITPLPFLVLATLLMIPKDMSNRFIEDAQWLKNEMKQISLDDDNWFLKTWDEDGVGMVKVLCEECGKDFGLGVWNHNTSTFTNLFLNFKKSHL
jgi:hypothetical protein